ncbi:MAG TPA: YceI family protein [Terriglobales bacterium]|nr:YceI family protein [Terriglobales bacterium]
MSKYIAVFAAAVILALGVLALGVPKQASVAGSWLVDSRHSDAQLITDGTTDYGKTKMNVTLGFTRVNGILRLDEADPTKSRFDFRLYPATSMAPPIEEDGHLKNEWLANLANHTLVCFHSKGFTRTADGRLQTTGNLTLTRVDRNVEATPNEAYAGPVYGPPIIHKVTREATFVFDVPAEDANKQKDGGIQLSGSTMLGRENFPQLVKAVVGTYWPPVVKDKDCHAPANVSEDYHGAECTGTLEMPAALPQPSGSQVGEDYPGPANFNAVNGNQLTILVHLQLTPRPGEMAAGGD